VPEGVPEVAQEVKGVQEGVQEELASAAESSRMLPGAREPRADAWCPPRPQMGRIQS
jgi:hypothetical protein